MRATFSLLNIIVRTSFQVVTMMRTEVFFYGGITAWCIISDVNSDLFATGVNVHHRSGINDLCADAHIRIGDTVVMFVFAQIDVIVVTYHRLTVVFYFKIRFWEGGKEMLFRSQKAFFPTIRLLLHAGLIMRLYFLFNGLVK